MFGQNSRLMSTVQLRDAEDLRDLVYRPALAPLPAKHFPEELNLLGDTPVIKIRDQRDSSQCTGYALAALIDIQRVETNGHADPVEPVSASMLYELGRLVSFGTSGSTPGRLSLRSTIKGFYHNGVCLESLWQDEDPLIQMTVDRAKNARSIALGTYYRVQQYLPDYHNALYEGKAIVASARVHDGWRLDQVRQHGRIEVQSTGMGAHAFVIIGYDSKGFYVFNSSGTGWAGVDQDTGVSIPGVAHWSYRDWAENIIDAWVLRLAVPTPESFDYSVGLQGRQYAYLADPQRRLSDNEEHRAADQRPGRHQDRFSTPRRCVIGHYLHLDNNQFVESGNYPDSAVSLDRTLNYLHTRISDPSDSDDPEQGPHRVYLRITGDRDNVEDSMARISVLRRRLRHQRVYPVSIVWCAGLAAGFSVAVNACVQEVVRKMPDPSGERDDLIEAHLRAIGQPFWRLLNQEAETLAHDTGRLDHILDWLNQAYDNLAATHSGIAPLIEPGNIDVVFEGAGSMVMAHWLRQRKSKVASLLRHTRRVHVVFPTLLVSELLDCLSQVAETDDAARRLLDEKFVLHVPTRSCLENSTAGAYMKSWFHLANNSFVNLPPGSIHTSRSDRTDLAREQYPDGIAALSLARLEAAVRGKGWDIPCRESGPEIGSRQNTSDALRWFTVGHEWLGQVLET